jgi:hypothetical protein
MKMDQVWKIDIQSLPGEPADELQNFVWKQRPQAHQEHRLQCPQDYRNWQQRNKRVLDELFYLSPRLQQEIKI